MERSDFLGFLYTIYCMRLDVALVSQNIYPTRARAAAAIHGGLVTVNGVVATKTSQAVSDTDVLAEDGKDSQTENTGGRIALFRWSRQFETGTRVGCVWRQSGGVRVFGYWGQYGRIHIGVAGAWRGARDCG